jgi:hypothetical protein
MASEDGRAADQAGASTAEEPQDTTADQANASTAEEVQAIAADQENAPAAGKLNFEPIILIGGAAVAVVAVLALIGLGVILAALPSGSSQGMEIIAAAQRVPAIIKDQSAAVQDGGSYTVTGRVLQHGLPLNEALVWLVAYDSFGIAYSPRAQRTNSEGEFSIASIPMKIDAKDAVKEIRITAVTSGFLTSTRTESRLSLEHDRLALKFSEMNTSWSVWVPLICFFFSIAVVGGASLYKSLASLAYYVGLGFSFLLTATTVWSIAGAINTFNTSVQHREIRNLGFLTMFEGTYVEGGGTEWLVSLTRPSNYISDSQSPDKSHAPVVHSFGAPVWVIFLTILGAGMLMIILIIQGVSGPPKFDDPSAELEVSQRMRTILEHQFFVLAAPLTGIFIYQLLVIAGAAKEPVTVATVILGAGATLNVLLARAVKSAEQYIQGKPTKEGT